MILESSSVPHRCVIIIPTYNNDQTLMAVLDEVLSFGTPTIVINDGSSDSTADLLSHRTDVTVLSHDSNEGKGSALREGFEYAYEQEFSHAITIDADGEHALSEIPVFLSKIDEDPEALWIGSRKNPHGKSPRIAMPFTGFLGNIGIRLFTGVTLTDCQSGFRLYPLHPIVPLELKRNRFDYEQEVLLEASWSGVELKEFPISVVEQSREDTVSHYHPLKDFLRISRVHTRAMITRFINPFSSLKVEGKNSREKIYNLVKQELVSHTTPLKGALAFSLGVFMGIFPIHGFQVVVLMFLATKLKLNRPLAFLGVNVSAPPFLPFLAIAAVKTGDLFLPGSISGDITSDTIEKGGAAFMAFMLGSTLLAPVASIIAFVISYPLFLHVKRGFGSRH